MASQPVYQNQPKEGLSLKESDEKIPTTRNTESADRSREPICISEIKGSLVRHRAHSQQWVLLSSQKEGR